VLIAERDWSIVDWIGAWGSGDLSLIWLVCVRQSSIFIRQSNLQSAIRNPTPQSPLSLADPQSPIQSALGTRRSAIDWRR
jgi:hypothetical protein